MRDLLTARKEAGTPRGIEFAKRLEAMTAEEAADEIMEMFWLRANEDLAYDIALDLVLDISTAERIATEITKRRTSGALRAARKFERADRFRTAGIGPALQCVNFP